MWRIFCFIWAEHYQISSISEGGRNKIELRSATNVDLYNTKSLDIKLQHDCGSFYSDDGYHSDLGLPLRCVNTFQFWLKKTEIKTLHVRSYVHL